jgi:hypothetical protein
MQRDAVTAHMACAEQLLSQQKHLLAAQEHHMTTVSELQATIKALTEDKDVSGERATAVRLVRCTQCITAAGMSSGNNLRGGWVTKGGTPAPVLAAALPYIRTHAGLPHRHLSLVHLPLWT